MTDQEILNCIYGIYPNRKDTPSTVDLLIKNNLAVKKTDDCWSTENVVITTETYTGCIDTHIPIGNADLMYDKYRKALVDLINLIGGEFD